MTNQPAARRAESRTSHARTGTIKAGLFKTIKCDISDLSSSGAKLETDQAQKLPEKFNLIISGSGKTRKHKCAKRWQEGNTVGVEFLFS
ncbi:MAG: PilZ domain-containing protein [Hyphomonadaceae bacterium]